MKKIIFVTNALLLSFVWVSSAMAQASPPKGMVQLDNPIPVVRPLEVFSQAAAYLLMVTGTLSFVAFMWGGFLFLTSAGGDRIKRGTDSIKYAAIGVILSFLGYVIMKSVFALFNIS